MRFVLAFVACVAVIILGLAVASISGPAGSVIAVAGIIGLLALFLFSWVKAARNNQGAYLTPGRGHREWREEHEKAARERNDSSR